MLPRALCLIVILSLLTPAFAKDKFSQPRPIQLDRDGEKWAQKTLHNLSLEEKVGQLFMIWVRAEFLNVNSPEYLQLRDSINKYHVGSFAMTVRAEGPFLYRNQPYEAGGDAYKDVVYHYMLFWELCPLFTRRHPISMVWHRT